MKSPVAVALFDILLEYAAALERAEESPNAPAINSQALTFCENFYAQFFQNVVGAPITGFDEAAKKLAIAERLKLRRRKDTAPVIQLVTWFERLCDEYPNLVAMVYGGGRKVRVRQFNQDYLTELLDRVVRWAEAKQLSLLVRKAGKAREALRHAFGAATT